ncbi:ribosome biogenesis protein Ytm1 [Schizosaccharomyces japonicus yFS275]|uniref:Ribosome biogenesis protein YTM1 n=1 Tax=Schizosaccharomyces japonicus (strain yFS275 / FY16936) TaxID=402676 RepID=B6K137_SCHJY|nr:ribosome biogenesis protein Ytm1 [Schizosaccharomyces japonicus yFS275]EEB07658.1 ribosome biogenesis protein Ytm1 [Schizosaccharomyces japonicus yFS275]
MSSQDEQVAQVQVRFTTRDPDYAVADTPILIPTTLRRYGLSQIVNHLLEKETPTPFDFLVNGKILTTSLDEYIVQNGLSTESVLTLEYIPSTLPPSFLAAFPHEDWISGISLKDDSILTSSYDGIARVWNKSGKVCVTSASLDSSLKSVAWTTDSSFLTASLNQGISLWSYSSADVPMDDDESSAVVADYDCAFVGHENVVERIRTGSSTLFLSAGADKMMGVWDLERSPATGLPTQTVTGKRRKKNTEVLPKNGAKAPLLMCTGHNGPVTDMVFATDTSVAYSVSQDHTIKTWDLITGQLVNSRITRAPLLCIQNIGDLNLLACGSAGRHITLHDPRASAEQTTSITLNGHKNFVSGLACSPENPYMLASVSHDNTTKVWDIRATSGSLYTLSRNVQSKSTWDKLFAIDWNSSTGIVTGGTDKQLQINQSTKGDIASSE